MTPRKTGAFAALLATLVGVARRSRRDRVCGEAQPIVIGWAFDGKGDMAPFDGPALAAAQIRVKQINAKGGVNGRTLQIITCDTQGNKPAMAKSCARELIGGGAKVIFTTCDVDLAAPVVQEAINRGVLAVAPCIGTDQMGPKRFGTKGRLAFTFGNVAQDEGSAMAEYAWSKGWKHGGARDRHASSSTSRTSCRRSRPAGSSSAARSSTKETLPVARRGNDVHNAVSRLNARRRT